MATAFEGELYNINAFNQPGVESYKNYMYYKLGKSDLPKNIISEIKKNRFKKRKEFIL
jgi:glucose-6-phosphate isomerase